MAKRLSDYTYAELMVQAAKVQKDAVKATKSALATALAEVEVLRAKLAGLTTGFTSAPKRRGRKPGSKNKIVVKAVRKTRKSRKSKGKLSEKILAFLATKGKEGAHVTDIAKHVGTKPNNVTAFMYTTGKKKGVKKVAPATFAYTS